MRRWYILFVLFVVFAAVGVGLHHRGFSGPFYFDSAYHFSGREHLYAGHSLLDVVKTIPSRVVSMSTFYLGYRIHGMDPYYFRLTSALMLAATGVALFMLVSIALEIPALELNLTAAERGVVAFGAALMFVVHTVQYLVVLYVIQRMALMACFFYVCCLTCYFATRMGRVRPPVAGYLVCGLLCLSGLFSKENGITIPAVVFVSEFIFFTRSTRLSGRLLTICLIPVALLASMLILVQNVFKFEGASGVVGYVSSDYEWTGLALHEVVMTQSRVLFGYMWTIAAPFLARIALVQPVVVSKTLFDPPVTAVAVAGLLALLVAGIVLLRRRPLAGFGVLTYVLVLVPESIFDPKFLCMQYRAVLPTVPFLLVLADLAAGLMDRARTRGRIGDARLCLGVLLSVWVALTAAATLSKAEIWRDPLLVWSDVVEGLPPEDAASAEKFPVSISLVNLGTALQRRGDVNAALRLYEKAISVKPDLAEALYNIGNIRVSQGRTEEAIRCYRRAIQFKPRLRPAYVSLGTELMRQGKIQEAKEQFEKAVNLGPHDATAQLNLGQALIKLGKPDEADIHLRTAVEHDPQMAAALFQLGVVFQMKGDLQQAARQFGRALAIDPDMLGARYNLADTMFRAGQFEQAAKQFSMVVNKDPADF